MSKVDAISLLRPYTAEWVRSALGSLTEPQRKAIPLIKKEKNVLISSPTGTGKTLAAFLGIIDTLYSMSEEQKLERGVYAVYVSPLRALNNDIRRNLVEPIYGIRKIAETKFGIKLDELKVAIRTSDTTQNERASMLRNPPHILITTPESLALILVSTKFSQNLKKVKWIIVDEIHELASSKRGANLSLMIERLENKVGTPLQRIGLSATIAPLNEIAKFLGGYDDSGKPREVKIVDARFKKPFDIKVIMPVNDLIRTPTEELNERIYEKIAELVKAHRSTLIFTNTRNATERVVYKLKKALSSESYIGLDDIGAHHSSLSRDIRLEVEEKLKRGELKAVVSSTSLELGIDIGYIDLVLLLSSPKSVSRLLQRVGRAGHRLQEVSKGRIITLDRDDLVECVVLADSAKKKLIDKTKVVENALDVLIQNVVAMSLEKKWNVDEAFRLIKKSYAFHKLKYEDFISVLEFLGGKDEKLEEQRVYRKIWYDPVEKTFGKKKSSRVIYNLNQGTIPDEAKIKVYLKGIRYLGDLDEGFAQILNPGDIFVLGGKTYVFRKIVGMKMIVDSAEGQRPTVPSWFSELLPLSFDSAIQVGKFRRRVTEILTTNEMDVKKSTEALMKEFDLDFDVAREIVNYIKEQYVFTEGIIPSDKLIYVEIYDENSTRNIIFHSLFGRRTNDALSRAYAFVLSNMLNYPIRVTVSDNAFMLSIPGRPMIDFKTLLGSVSKKNIDEILRKAVGNTEMMRRRFRHCAQRSFMILRNYKGKEKSPNKLQLNAQVLLEAIKDDTNNPVLKETYREILEDYMDIRSAKKVLNWIEKGEVKIQIGEATNVPSPFAHHIIAIGYQDIVLMEDKRKLLLSLYEKVLEHIGKLADVFPASNS